ncbi:MAG: MBL fold metallo-hydrolase [Geobacter sp.]|nr:MBL fold metallo-hydrolase [Geobacter sp.]
MTHRITILCDNTVGPMGGTLGEHGFAALVEGNAGSLLFDTGQGMTLLHNAGRMNRDLSAVCKVALSHGHYDHTGGMLKLLKECGHKEVFAHPGVFARRYRVKDTGESVPIGIPFDEEMLCGLGARFSYGTGWREIAAGVFLTGEVPRLTGFEKGDSGLFCDDCGCTADTFPDDQSLVIRTERGLVLLLGCCHAGLVNAIVHAREMTGVDDIYAIIGGTHLGFCSPEQMEETVKALRSCRVKKLSPCHCTGFAAAARLAREFPQAFHHGAVGYTLEI